MNSFLKIALALTAFALGASANLHAATAPAITTQPANKTVTVGSAASFTVVATGSPTPTYQWKKGTTAISGATSATYSIAATTTASAGTYSVVVTNSAGSVTSASATLTINVAPAITTQPTSKTVTAGASASFSVVATGTPTPTFQWKKGTTAITGATSATYTIAATTTASAGTYSVVVTNSVGSVTSASATLSVNVAPAITTQPASTTVTAGASASFTVVATGTPAPTYQWKKGTTAISGATNATYTIAATTTANAGTYSVVVTNSVGSVTSSSATLTVNATVAPTITTQPVSKTVSAGASASFTVLAAGTPAPTFQWKKGTATISGATSATYTIPATVTGDAGTYSVVVTNSAGSVTSSSVTLTVTTGVAPTITTQPVSRVVNSGASTSFSVVATGTPAPTYQWKKGTSNISGATSATYTIAAVAAANAGTYSVVVTNSAGSVTSTNATLALNTPPTVSLTQPPAYSSYTLPATIHLAATASDADGTVAKVEFFAGSSKLGESFAAPYTFDWSATTAGAVVLTARATDNLGATKTSAAIGIQSMPGLPYIADFEAAEGYVTGTLDNQLGWNVTSGTAQVNNAAAAYGTQSVVLNPGTVAAKVDQEFGPGSTNPPNVFVDFFAKPVAGTDTATGTVFDVDVAQVAFVQNGASGAFAVLDGDGNGAGEWRTLGTPVALGADHAATDWQRLTLALHYSTKTWDLFVGSQPVSANLKFRIDSSAYLNLFSLKGHTAAGARLDDFYVGVTNPLFADINNDGIDDAWETAHGLSLAVNQRDLDSDGDGLTNLEEYVLGTDPMKVDTDGDGLSDAEELALGTNPLTAGSYGPALPVVGARIHLRADLGPVTDGAGLVSRWVNLASLGSDAFQSDPNRRPSWVANQLNGLPTVHFSGNDQVLYLPDLMAGAIAGEIIAVTKVGDKRTGGFGDLNNKLWAFDQNGAGYYPGWESDLEFSHYNTFGSDPGLGTSVPVSLVSNYHIFDTVTSAALCAEYFNGALWQSGPGQQASFASEPNLGAGVLFGDFAEIIVFDRALDDAERDLVGRYLTRKYRPESLPVPAKPTLRAFPVSGTKVDLDWSSSTATAAGTTATIERQTGSGAFVVVAIPVNVSTYSDTGLDSGQHYTYRVTLENWAGVSPASDSQSIATLSSPTLPADGLRLWLRSTAGTQGEGPLARWADQSGRGYDGVQKEPSRQPVVIAGQLNGLPVVRFNQSQGSVLAFPDLMAQALGGEAIVVVRRSSTGENVGLWGFGLSHGSRYPEGDGELFDDFATNAWVGTGPAPTLIEGFHIYDVGGDATKWVQLINGTVQLQRPTNTVGFRVDPVIGSGQGFDGPGPGFDGDIAEILIYDRVLSGPDRTVITRYLNTKYSLGIVFDTVPPTAPSSVVATKITASSFVLNWTGSSDDVSVADYEVYRDGVSLGFTVAPNFAVTGMTPESTHELSVRARDTSGNLSPWSSGLTVSTMAPLAVPSGVVVSAASSDAITISWAPQNTSAGVVSYSILVNGSSVGSTSSTSFTLRGLVPTGSYNVTIIAVDAAGNTSGSSEPASVLVPDGAGTNAKPVYAFIILPEGFLVGGGNIYKKISQSATQLLRKMNGNTCQIFRWKNGDLELLAAPQNGLSGYDINRNGTIAVGTANVINVWRSDSVAPYLIISGEFLGAGIPVGLGGPMHSEIDCTRRQYAATWTAGDHAHISLDGIGDDERVWYCMVDKVDIGNSFVKDGQTYRYADYVMSREYWYNAQTGAQQAADGATRYLRWPSGCISSSTEFSHYSHFGIGTRGLAHDGTPLGENNGQYVIGPRVVDYKPLDMDRSGRILGAWDWATSRVVYSIEYPDSSRLILPTDDWTYYYKLDEKGRPHGWDAWSDRGFFVEIKEANGGKVIERRSYVSVTPPDGWATTLQVPPDCDDIQMDTVKNVATGAERTFIAVPAEIAVDLNRDGVVSSARQGDFDATSADKPFRFWLNDDDDHGSVPGDAGEEHVPAVRPDHSINLIGSRRDLEDYARLWISTQGLNAAFQNGDMFLGLKWEVSTGAPAIKVFPAVEADGGAAYLTDGSTGGTAQQQAAKYALIDERYAGEDQGSSTHTLVGGTDVFVLPKTLFANLSEAQPKTFLLFEGCSAGKGQLKLVILDKNKQVIGEGPGVWMDLKNIQSMYQRVKVTPSDPGGIPKPYYESSTFNANTTGTVPSENGFPLEAAPDEASSALVFVHGSNISYEEARGNAETMFKRLYWQRYNGRFVLFNWDTLVGIFDGTIPAIPYNGNEYRALKYGHALRNFVTSLAQDRTVNVASHSLGAGVVLAALKEGMVVNNYLLLQAAFSAKCYDSNLPAEQRFVDAETILGATPDLAADLGYGGYLSNVQGTLVNMFNPVDFALATGTALGVLPANWEQNQIEFKPDHDLAWLWQYCYIKQLPPNYTGPLILGRSVKYGLVAPFRPVDDPHESMAFIARSRTKAVGALAGVGGVISQEVQLDNNTYQFGRTRPDHSGEFSRNIQELQPFYRLVFEKVR